MNLSSISTNPQNNTSFGMAFVKPAENVQYCYRQVMKNISPNERAKFVKDVSEVVQGAKSNEIPIKLSMNGSTRMNMEVADKTFIVNELSTKNILNSMRSASAYADDVKDLNNNCKLLDSIF